MRPAPLPRRPAGALAALAGLAAGCTIPGAAEQGESRAFAPEYLGVETRKMDAELVNILVAMRGARARDDVADYARCAAAQYSLIRGYGFARHVRTTVYREAGTWRADAVYTVSPDLPDGVRTVDAEVTVADCAAQGIPTV